MKRDYGTSGTVTCGPNCFLSFGGGVLVGGCHVLAITLSSGTAISSFAFYESSSLLLFAYLPALLCVRTIT